MKLLLLAPFPYGEKSGHGGAMACASFLKQLSRDHEVRVLCFRTDSEASAADIKEMGEFAKVDSVILSLSKIDIIFAKLLSVVRFKPEIEIYHSSKKFSRLLSLIEREFQPDAVVVQFPQMAQYLREIKCAFRIQDVQDAYSVSWYRRAMTSRLVKRPYMFFQWLAWIASERRNYLRAQQCWALSQDDCFGLKVFLPDINVVPIGVPLIREESFLPVAGQRSEKFVIGFIGSYTHAPNVEALEWLVMDIAVQLKKIDPSLIFRIAGRNPPQYLVQAAPENVQFSGYVESLQDFYSGCDVAIAPLRSGGGVKIKSIEALAYGVPLISTPIGAEGLGLVDQQDVIIFRNTEEAVDSILKTCSDEPHRVSLAANGRNKVLSQFSAERWRSRINDLLFLH